MTDNKTMEVEKQDKLVHDSETKAAEANDKAAEEHKKQADSQRTV